MSQTLKSRGDFASLYKFIKFDPVNKLFKLNLIHTRYIELDLTYPRGWIFGRICPRTPPEKSRLFHFRKIYTKIVYSIFQSPPSRLPCISYFIDNINITAPATLYVHIS